MKVLGRFDAALPGAAELDALVLAALREDEAFGDRSTAPLPGRERIAQAAVVARTGGVLAGRAVLQRAFELLAGEGEVDVEGSADGEEFEAGERVLSVRAPAGALLSGERTALNFLQRLSGIATRTRLAVRAAAGLPVSDTRKTTPGLRALEKYAVVQGGGTSHRWSLGDMVMLKENHLALAGGVGPAVAAIRADPSSSRLPLTVEVRSLEQAREAAALGVDRLLLDNLSPARMREIVEALGPAGSRPELEASGGIGLEDLPAVAACGVDVVSLGSLTHSVPATDFSMLFEEAE